MIANRTGTIHDYILEVERDLPEDEQTVFQLKTLSRKATAVIQDSLIGYDTTGDVLTSRPGTAALVACKLGIAGWRNMKDDNGVEVRPHTITSGGGRKTKGRAGAGLPNLSPKSLDAIPQWALDELGGEIMELNGLTTTGDEDVDKELEEEGNPTETSPTPIVSSSLPPSAPTTPKTSTASSDSSGLAPDAPAPAPLPAPRLATDAGAAAG